MLYNAVYYYRVIIPEVENAVVICIEVEWRALQLCYFIVVKRTRRKELRHQFIIAQQVFKSGLPALQVFAHKARHLRRLQSTVVDIAAVCCHGPQKQAEK